MLKQHDMADRAEPVTGIPSPPPITPAIRDALREESFAWRIDMAARVRAIESLTGSDWTTRVR